MVKMINKIEIANWIIISAFLVQLLFCLNVECLLKIWIGCNLAKENAGYAPAVIPVTITIVKNPQMVFKSI